MLVRGAVGWGSDCSFGAGEFRLVLRSASPKHQAIVRPKQCYGAQPLSRLLDTGEPPALQLQTAAVAPAVCSSRRTLPAPVRTNLTAHIHLV